jgi:hypothetical protein
MRGNLIIDYTIYPSVMKHNNRYTITNVFSFLRWTFT